MIRSNGKFQSSPFKQ